MSAGTVKRRRPWLARQDWFFALALALFVGVSVWFGRAIQDFFQPSARALTTPTLVGQTLSDALRTADRVKLHAVVVSREPSDQYPKDLVVRQEPAAGSEVRAGRQISLVVSSGTLIFPMPDLRYETQREVDLDLAHDKLLPGKSKLVESDEVPANHVVSQDPPPLSSVRIGTTVNLTYSKGGQTRLKVPNFTGLTVDEARDIASRARIRFGQIVWTPFGRWGPPRGAIVRQNPPAGASIDDSTDLVSLQVSAGPRESGYLVRQVHATVTVPEQPDAGGKAPAVRIAVTDETGEWNVYDAYAQPRQKLDFNLTVIGTAELDTYVNNELLGSTKIGVEPAVQEKQRLGSAPARATAPTSPAKDGFP
jgi:beta-lactam-binding protein with PASTA domain